MDSFDFDFNRAVNRFDKQLRSFDRMFEGMEKQYEMDLGKAGKWEEWSLPQVKLVNIATEPDHYRYDFSVQNIPSGKLLVNSYEDRYGRGAFLSLRIQDAKDDDKTYEYVTDPSGKVIEQKLLTGPEKNLALENAKQGQTDGKGMEINPAQQNDTALSKDLNRNQQKHYVHISSSGNTLNAMTYRLPEDVSERELGGIRAERKADQGLLCVYIPRRSMGNLQEDIQGRNVTNIPVKDV